MKDLVILYDTTAKIIDRMMELGDYDWDASDESD
jgi:hypothetical protein